MTNSSDPLWRVLHRAHMDADPLSSTYGYAAEIRALADWLVPEEHVELLGQWPSQWVTRAEINQRQAIRQRLLAEADRVEAGE